MAAGRPRTITDERIVDAGIVLTLPELTVAGLAAQMGVTVASIYKHAEGIEQLRLMIAEGIMARWSIPQIDGQPIADYLTLFSASLRELVQDNPGIAGFLSRVNSSAPATFLKIDAHHADFARTYSLSATQAAWLLSTVAEHAIAISDMAHMPRGRVGSTNRQHLRERTDLRNFNKVQEIFAPGDQLSHFKLSMRALISGALLVVSELP